MRRAGKKPALGYIRASARFLRAPFVISMFLGTVYGMEKIPQSPGLAMALRERIVQLLLVRMVANCRANLAVG